MKPRTAVKRDAFAGFCETLFDQRRSSDSTAERLRLAGVLPHGKEPPSSREERVGLIRRADPSASSI